MYNLNTLIKYEEFNQPSDYEAVVLRKFRFLDRLML